MIREEDMEFVDAVKSVDEARVKSMVAANPKLRAEGRGSAMASSFC